MSVLIELEDQPHTTTSYASSHLLPPLEFGANSPYAVLRRFNVPRANPPSQGTVPPRLAEVRTSELVESNFRALEMDTVEQDAEPLAEDSFCAGGVPSSPTSSSFLEWSSMATDSDPSIGSSDHEDDFVAQEAVRTGLNSAVPIRGPYATPWEPDHGDLWSSALVQLGYLGTVDAILLTFTIDYALKVYVVRNLEVPSADSLGHTDLVWAIFTKVHDKLRSAVLMQHAAAMNTGEEIMFCVMNSLPKIRERCSITFDQAVQDVKTQANFAEALFMDERLRRFAIKFGEAYQWLYGKSPITFFDSEERQTSSNYPAVSIRQWVFEYN